MKCAPSHKEEYSVSIEVIKTTMGILGYFGVYLIISGVVAYVLF